MKRYSLFTLFAATLFTLGSCDQVTGPEAAAPFARIDNVPALSWIAAEGVLVPLTANVPVTVDLPADASWLTYYGMEMTSRATNAYVLVFDVAGNAEPAERHATLQIRAREDETLLLTYDLVQEAAEEPYFDIVDTFTASYAGAEEALNFRTNVPYRMASSDPWLQAGTDPEDPRVLLVQVAPNEELQERTGTLSFLFGERLMATLTVVQRGRPSQGIVLEPVWAKDADHDAAWYESIGMAVGVNQDRTIAMDDAHVYLPLIANNNPGNTWGIAVLDRATGAFQRRMAEEAGIEKVGLWAVSDVQVMDDGNGGSVLLACNMSRRNENNQLRIYAWTDLDAAPQVVSYSFAATHPDSRFGDRMGVSGNWQEGELYFTDYFPGATQRPLLVFSIRGGVISGTPLDTRFGSNLTGSSNMATLCPLGSNLYLYSGTSNLASNLYSCLVSRTGDSFSAAGTLDPAKGFDAVMNGVHPLEVEGLKYLVYATTERNAGDQTVYLKTLPLEGDTFAAGVQALGSAADASSYDLSNGGTTAGRNGNHTADTALWQIDGQWYVAAVGTGSGVALFRVKAI